MTKAIGAPAKAAGTLARARRSRRPAKITMTREKASAEPKPNRPACSRPWLSRTLIKGTPSTAQLVVISGR
ncbi:hypothetical protein D3C84_901550 [compost metagenome]